MGAVRKKLADIFGDERVLDEKKVLCEYARDQSFAPGRKPDFVVFPQSVDEIQQVIRLANETSTPVIPYSSGLNLHGAALPDHGGIVLNLSRMNNILEIDKNNWFVVVEPG
ncbi:MAG: FAD-binding oxidoreductase, partial [Methanosarcinaceae archaeon]|nr:FAD-binding oxidoreductase [Methanosarcinaceae archaeon]